MKISPGFIIAGAAKSGTTALHYMLDQHPDVFMSGIKETNYFIYAYEKFRHWRYHPGSLAMEAQVEDDVIDSKEKYLELFSTASEGQLTGESSPAYLMNTSVPVRIYNYNPDVKIILILRNPSDVAYANYVHQVRDKLETIKLPDAIRILQDEHYDKKDLHPFAFHLGLPEYSLQLPGYVNNFDSKQIKILIYEEFLKNKKEMLAEIIAFLRLPPCSDINVDRQVNISGVPRSNYLQKVIQGNGVWKKIVNILVPKKKRREIRAKIEAMNTGKKPVMDAELRSGLDKHFLKDIECVENILGREVKVWREQQA